MLETPHYMIETPDLAQGEVLRLAPDDALSSVLSIVRMRGELICSSEFSAPFAIGFPAGPSHFHAIESGEVWVLADRGRPAMRIGAGSFLLFPRGDGHVLSDIKGRKPVPLAVAAKQGSDRERRTFKAGGGGEITRMLCARFRYTSRLADSLLAALPHVIVIRPECTRPVAWLEATARALRDEVVNSQPGSAITIARLLDLVFVQMLRLWCVENQNEAGWLAGAGDTRISRALTLIHNRPQHAWGVTELAGHAGLSRSSFATRFAARVGEPPASYIANWRMNLAADLLCSGRESIKTVASRVGYNSEAGFSRAFKSRFQVSPFKYRERVATT